MTVSITHRLQAAFGAFVAPEKFTVTQTPGDPASRDSASLADPLALPPDWHGANGYGGDLLALSFLPFDR